MKKQLLLGLFALLSGNLFAYEFYVANKGTMPIKAKLYVKGIVWNWDQEFTVAPNQYCRFSTVAYCGKSVVINDGRGSIPSYDQRLPQQQFDIPAGTACHTYQVIEVTEQTAAANSPEAAYLAAQGYIDYTGFSINYFPFLPTNKAGADARLSGLKAIN